MSERLASPSGHDPTPSAVKRQPAGGGEPMPRARRHWSSVAVGIAALAALFAMAYRSRACSVFGARCRLWGWELPWDAALRR